MRYITLCCLALLSLFVSPAQAQQNKGELANLVIFVRFADEDESIFDKTAEEYANLFNAEEETVASVYNYFQQASYKQLKWKSVIYPVANNTNVVSYKAQRSRGYYLHYSSVNPEGYDENNAADALLREQNLVKEITDYINTVVPSDVNLDANGDGVIDNICIILSGNSEISSRYMFWPHRSTLYIKQGAIQGKKVNEYVMLFDGANGWKSLSPIELNLGVICHEMSHTLGTRDLYHTQKGLNPIGVWDLMSDNLLTPQGMSAFTKFKYCKWIDEIPEISTPGVYTLNPVGGTKKDNIAYKIKPSGSDEYFVVEYRKQDNLFEKGLPGSGLLVYRINPSFTGNEGYNGTTKFDEQYLFRPGGTITADGNIEQATFSSESGRIAFGGSAVQKPFYTDGREANFAIANVSASGETISFELLPFSSEIHLSQSEITLDGSAGSSFKVQVQGISTGWKIESLPDWIEVSTMTGEAGLVDLTITAKSENLQSNLRSFDLILKGNNDTDVQSVLTVTQKSSIIQSPYGLSAQQDEENSISLTWKKPFEGAPVFSEGFEDVSNKDAWTFVTANNVGWVWQANERNKLPYEGGFSARLNSEMLDRHQDEWLISPVFSNGSILTFYSNSIAPGKSNIHNFYYVKVSNDGGLTWNEVYDLKKQSKVVNKYEQIEVDLSDYLSDNMRIAFHAYDDNDEGLYFWWHVDNIQIYPHVASSVVEKYEVYRNGENIGTSADNSFVDANPVAGTNTYKVKAVGAFGETAFSNEFAIEFSPLGISDNDANEDIVISVNEAVIDVVAFDKPLQGIILSDLRGRVLYEDVVSKTEYNVPITSFSKGVYILNLLDFKGTKRSYKLFIK